MARRRWRGRLVGAFVVLVLLSSLVALGGWLWLRTGLPALPGEITLPGLGQPVEIALRCRGGADDPRRRRAGWRLRARIPACRRTGSSRWSSCGGSRAGGSPRWSGRARSQATVTCGSSISPTSPRPTSTGCRPRRARFSRPMPAGSTPIWLRTGAPGRRSSTCSGLTPEPWRPQDSLLWGRLMSLQLSTNWPDEWLRARLAQRLTPAQLESLWPAGAPSLASNGAVDPAASQRAAWNGDGYPPGPPGASNGWAVAGPLTETGQPLLANDPASRPRPADPVVSRPHRDAGAHAHRRHGARRAVPHHSGTTTGSPGASPPPPPTTRICSSKSSRPSSPTTIWRRMVRSLSSSARKRFRCAARPTSRSTVRSTRHGPVISDLGRAAGIAGARRGDRARLGLPRARRSHAGGALPDEPRGECRRAPRRAAALRLPGAEHRLCDRRSYRLHGGRPHPDSPGAFSPAARCRCRAGPAIRLDRLPRRRLPCRSSSIRRPACSPPPTTTYGPPATRISWPGGSMRPIASNASARSSVNRRMEGPIGIDQIAALQMDTLSLAAETLLPRLLDRIADANGAPPIRWLPRRRPC